MNRRNFLKLSGLALASSGLSTSLGSVPAASATSFSSISIRWLGAAMMEMDLAGIRFLTDPCLGEGKEAFQMADPNEMFDLAKGPNIKMHERLSSYPGTAHSSHDAVLLSHAHEDHFDQKAQAWLGDNGPLVAPAHDLAELEKKGFSPQTLVHGATREFSTGTAKISVTAVPAIHSQNSQIAEMLGEGNGYWIELIENGQTRTIYWAGDTFLADPNMAFLKQRPAPDLFIPHIGNVGINGALGQLSMNGRQAIEFAEQIGTKHILPVHHSTYALYQEPVSAMIEAHQAIGTSSSLHVIAEGAVLNLLGPQAITSLATMARLSKAQRSTTSQ